MCRLLYLPAGIRPPFPKLVTALCQLVKSFGGDGNGLATTSGLFSKGLRLSAWSAAEMLHHDKPHDAIFHTRKTSMGLTVDQLCHPFLTRRGGFLAHNGHWSEASVAQSVLGSRYSDTRVAAHYISLYGWDRFVDNCDSGVWLYLKGDGLRVHYASGQLKVHESGILASEACLPGEWYDAKYGTYKPGEWIPEQPKYTFPASTTPNLITHWKGHDAK